MDGWPKQPDAAESPAPVTGGLRWRRCYRNIFDLRLRDLDLTVGQPSRPEPAAPRAETRAAPQILSLPPAEAQVGVEYRYQARAYDSDTDAFTWYAEKSPPGLSVDRHTGKITWTPAEGGHVEIILCARSIYGVVARQGWTVCVRKPAPVRRPRINRRFAEALRKKTAAMLPPLRFFRRAFPFRAAPPAAPPRLRIRPAPPLRI